MLTAAHSPQNSFLNNFLNIPFIESIIKNNAVIPNNIRDIAAILYHQLYNCANRQ